MLRDIQKRYLDGSLNKWQYIEEMYNMHLSLFDYSGFIKETNISKIEITDDKLIMTFRQSGIRMSVGKNDSRLVPLETLNFGTYENEELQTQVKLINPDDTIYDIGANCGWFSLHVAKAFPNAQIFSFEPIPDTFQYLKENITLNNLNNISPYLVGLSDTAGSIDLFYDKSSSGNASLKNVANKEVIQTVKCEIETIDNLTIKDNTTIDYIKCDIEGAELLALKGGLKTIERDLPIIFAEMLRKWTAQFNYHPNEIIQLLAQLHYTCFYLKDKRLQKIDLITDSTPQTNFFFLHTNKHHEKIKTLS